MRSLPPTVQGITKRQALIICTPFIKAFRLRVTSLNSLYQPLSDSVNPTVVPCLWSTPLFHWNALPKTISGTSSSCSTTVISSCLNFTAINEAAEKPTGKKQSRTTIFTGARPELGIRVKAPYNPLFSSSF